MSKRVIFFTILIVIHYYGYTQTSFKYGPELGFSFSEFPHQRGAADTSGSIKFINYPLVSPVIGINNRIIIGKHLLLTGGLQYQMSGNREYVHREEIHQKTATVTDTLIVNTWDKQTFHKLGLPINIGFTFKVKNIPTAIFIGYRPNLFIYATNTFIESGSYAGRNYYNKIAFNPLNKENIVPIKKFNNQVTLGSTLNFKENISITLCYYYGGKYLYAKDNSWGGYLNNTDYTMIISYLFSSNKKQ